MNPTPTQTRASTAAWLLLLALTLTSFALSDGHAALPILLVALVKASLVGFHFMELRSAHVVWRTAFAGLVALIVVAFWAIRLRSLS